MVESQTNLISILICSVGFKLPRMFLFFVAKFSVQIYIDLLFKIYRDLAPFSMTRDFDSIYFLVYEIFRLQERGMVIT